MDRNPSETLRKTTEAAFSRLTTEMRGGRNEALMRYLDAMSRLRGYSWCNVLVIAAQRPDAKQVAGSMGGTTLGVL